MTFLSATQNSSPHLSKAYFKSVIYNIIQQFANVSTMYTNEGNKHIINLKLSCEFNWSMLPLGQRPDIILESEFFSSPLEHQGIPSDVVF